MKYVLILLTVLCSCSKSSSDSCEQWEYYDHCEPKSQSVICGEDHNVQGSVCGDRLADAKAGRTSVIDDNADRKLTRHYIRKI
jgi:hypothetical protein